MLTALLISDTFDVPLPLSTSGGCEGNQEAEEELSAMLHKKELQAVNSLPKDVSNAHEQASVDGNEQLEDVVKLYDHVWAGHLQPNVLGNNDIVKYVREKLLEKKTSLSEESKTAELWIQYLKMVDILQTFWKAERTGNWLLHLSVVQEMLPYLAAAGRNLYTKSAYLYLQSMNNLNNTNPTVYDSFVAGNHVVRRSNRAWAGLSSDLTIEQTLMQGAKSTGGLTRGRGITEFQRAKWVLSMPACTEMSNAMQEVTATQRTTSDQHIESSEGRSSKDASDSLAITSFLAERNPFSGDPSLRNIVTGVVADSDVDVTEAEEKGLAILKSMKGKSAAELSFKTSDQVKTLRLKNSKTGNNEKLQTVYPQLLFQRCLTGSASISIAQSELFCFELCGYPSALFESHQFIPHSLLMNITQILLLSLMGTTPDHPPKI